MAALAHARADDAGGVPGERAISAVVGIDPRDKEASPPDVVDGFTAVRSDTALAFLVAPAVPSAFAALALAITAVREGGLVSAFFGFWVAFVLLAFVGYLSALVIGVPAYLLIRWRTRVIPPVVAALVGGIVAALPWTVLAVAARDEDLLVFAVVIFGLGCVGGISFSFVRDGRPWRAAR